MKKFILFVLAFCAFSAYAQQTTKLKKINNPREEGTRYPISMKSNANGVCKFLGYASALKGSMGKSTYYHYGLFGDVKKDSKEYAIVIDKNGEIKSVSHGTYIHEITCLTMPSVD